ncbi:hypothetical protein DCAR_0101094 [Daucus carota subsp. sativus]|uniref:RNase H type-1 domain-containing protein n=1 Tax=Daucus carota subsp. sativus TaxID=79200 RepID=A0A166G4V3_DAUCS|nr:hypothetical protein DCAR_0101094 [Daucus carota subsp. sativus]
MPPMWSLPSIGFVKINVHAVYYDPPLPNGNTTGIGVVIRDDEGFILAILTGSLGHINQRANELWAIQLGLQLAFQIGEKALELESESAAAIQEWDDHRWFTDPRHSRMVEQLNQRLSVGRIHLVKRVVVESQNMLARYLAEDGAATKFRVVRMKRPFGRVRELWHLDMGLGFIGGNFGVVNEEEYAALQQQEMMEEHGHAEGAGNGDESAGSVGNANQGQDALEID